MYNKDSKITYYSSNEFGIIGRRAGTDIKERLSGIEFLLGETNNKSVLDIGCAEGLISLEFAKNGASTINGFDIQDISINKAIQVFEQADINTPYTFKQVNLNNFNNAIDSFGTDDNYDIVLFLGVYHHLNRDSALKVLNYCFSHSNEYVAIRTDSNLPHIKEMQKFELIKDDNSKNITGRIRIYKKINI